jgi:hypothetical protein
MTKTSTHRRRQIIVLACQCASNAVDDEALIPWVPDEEIYHAYDDRRIGGEGRKALAALLRRLRTIPEARAFLKATIARVRKSAGRRPGDWGLPTKDDIKRGRTTAYRPRRLYPVTVTRKATKAKRHADCQYCGWGIGDGICGACKKQGIDGGPTIPGTSARKASTYTKWVTASGKAKAACKR